MHHEKTVSTLYLQTLFDYLEGKGLDISPLHASVESKRMHIEDKRIDAHDFQALMQQAVVLSGDSLLGLHVGELIKPGYYGPLGYMAMSCKTLGGALQKHLQYQQLVSNHGRVELETGNQQICVIWHPQIAHVDRHVVENIFSAWVCFARWICGRNIVPNEVLFQHVSSGDPAEYRRVFGCPVKFEQRVNAISLPRDYIDQPLVQADIELMRHFEDKAAQLIEKLQQEEDPFLQQLKIWMTQALLQDTLSLASAAQQFGVTPRSLQRKLAQKQQSYKSMLDTIRKELAQQHVCSDSSNLSELSFLLGFADQPALQRAFKRWTGMTPGQYRKRYT